MAIMIRDHDIGEWFPVPEVKGIEDLFRFDKDSGVLKIKSTYKERFNADGLSRLLSGRAKGDGIVFEDVPTFDRVYFEGVKSIEYFD